MKIFLPRVHPSHPRILISVPKYFQEPRRTVRNCKSAFMNEKMSNQRISEFYIHGSVYRKFILIRSNKIQQYAGIYCKITLHVSGVHRTWKYAKAPSTKKKPWRDSLPIDMLLSDMSVLVVVQSSSEIPEGLMNNPV